MSHNDPTFACEVDAEGVAMLSTGPVGGLWNSDFVEALAAQVDRALGDASVRALVLRMGSRAGVAELDAQWLHEATGPELGDAARAAFALDVEQGDALGRRVAASSKPVVAAIDGIVSGPVAELALACRARVAVEGAGTRLAFSLGRLGLPPMLGAAERLQSLVGAAATKLLAEGKDILLGQAVKLGLIDEAVAGDALASAAKARALSAIAQRPKAVEADPADRVQRFVDAAFGSVSRAMVGTLAIGVARANRLARRPAGVPRKTFARVGVLGAGLMGSGIACVCAKAGMQVVLIDVDRAAAERGLAALRKQEDTSVAAGREDASVASAWLGRITPSGRYEDLGDVDIVVEAVFEDREVKATATRRAEAAMPEGALYATNTSTLPIGGLAQASKRPDRFIGLHFFSPVPRMPLLEIIRGAKTSDTTLAEALDFAQAIAKTPIVVADHRGFYTSRVIMTYQAEAFEMLAEGVPAELVELAGKASGMPLPPLLLSDAVALDLIHQINLQTRRDTGSTAAPTRAQQLVGAMVERHGRLGKKNGKGFYDYEADGGKRLWPELQAAFGPACDEPPSLEELRDRLLGIQALEAARCLDEGVIADPSEGDVGALLGWSFAPWTGGPLAYIDGQGVPEFVARCDALAERLGARFAVPESLRAVATSGRTVHTADWSSR
jgi:3-hydroxyacyl-CoA dehydrogenase/enoyl-CoA hydratase/3-hydroxybutyryl-CoA epimerase